jgi:hypothetical protein
MQFFWFFISWTSDSYKIGEGVGSGFFWSNHQTGLVFKTILLGGVLGAPVEM